jgi:hypothetical protein
MNPILKATAAAALGFLISQMCGCVSSSRLVDTWHDPSFHATPLGTMLVIAIRKDATKRRIWEDAFVGELVKHGVTAKPSYTMFPDAPPDTNQVIATVKANGFDGILVILSLPTETNTHYIAGYTSLVPDYRYRPYTDPYWSRYWTYYREIEHPGYTDSQHVDIRAIDVSTTGVNGRMIWSATSRTPDPGTVKDVQQWIAGLVIADLAKRSIINKGK